MRFHKISFGLKIKTLLVKNSACDRHGFPHRAGPLDPEKAAIDSATASQPRTAWQLNLYIVFRDIEFSFAGP
jgi:hypothetical protein